MPSHSVADRNHSAILVVSTAENHRNQIASELGSQLSSHLRPGESLPDLGLLVELFARDLESKREVMMLADAAHEAELSDDAAFRSARDEAIAELVSALVDARSLLSGVYGSSSLLKFGYRGAIPKDPIVLTEFSMQVVRSLRRGPLPSPKREGIEVDVTRIAEELEGLLKPLQVSLRDVTREVREADVTLANKRDSTRAYDACFRRTAHFLVGALMAAGEPALAERITPSSERPGVTRQDGEGVGS